jgi:hypothetical protein
MRQESGLFDISRNVWQSFSSKQLLEDSIEFEEIKLLSLQWFYCNLSTDLVVMLGVDVIAGYQLAADMLNTSIDSLSEEDEKDAVVELMNCICGQLDRDHPADECFDYPKLLPQNEVKSLLQSLSQLSVVTAKAEGRWFYIALFEAKATGEYGGVE